MVVVDEDEIHQGGRCPFLDIARIRHRFPGYPVEHVIDELRKQLASLALEGSQQPS